MPNATNKVYRSVLVSYCCVVNENLLSYNSGGKQGCVPSGSFRGESISLNFLASGLGLLSLVHGCFLHLENQQWSIFKSLSVAIISLFLTLILLLFSYKDPVITVDPLGEPRIISPSQNPELTHTYKVPFATEGNRSQGIRHGYFWRAIIHSKKV